MALEWGLQDRRTIVQPEEELWAIKEAATETLKEIEDHMDVNLVL